MTHAQWCTAAFSAVGAETLLWLYSFRYIAIHTNPRGDGMEWLAAVPFTGVFLVFVLPSLIGAVIGFWSQRAAQIAAALAALAAVLDVVVWVQIAAEFAGKTP
jgi:ABC-type branched-subunit amino acid transport system permease subunit